MWRKENCGKVRKGIMIKDWGASFGQKEYRAAYRFLGRLEGIEPSQTGPQPVVLTVTP